MMELQNISDVKLHGRALSQGWLNNRLERRQRAVDALFDVVENSGDEKMRIEAFSALVRADVADIKRQEIEIKKQAADGEKRLRLLELLKHIPSGTLDKIVSGDTGDSGA